MRVLWFTNIPMPDLAAHLGLGNMIRGHWMSQLLSALKDRGDLQLGVVTACPGAKSCRLSLAGIDYYVIGQPRFQSIFSCHAEQLSACVDIVNSFRPDVIHVHGSERFFGLIGARWMVECPMLISIQGLLQPYAEEFFGALKPGDLWRAESFREMLTYRGLMWSYQKFQRGVAQEGEILRGANAVAGRTKWDEDWARVLAPRAHYFHIDEMLRPEFFESAWGAGSYQEHSIIFTNAGTPGRGTEILLSAVQMLKTEFPKTVLRLAGSSGRRFGRLSAYDGFVRRRIADLGLSNCVEWLGQLDSAAMTRALRESHVFAICSYVENSSNSLCEAMAVGVPCVASFAGGMPSLLEEERTGLFFPKGDAAGVAANIRRLFRARDLCVRLSTAARRTARLRHDPQRVLSQTMSAYGDLAGRYVALGSNSEQSVGAF